MNESIIKYDGPCEHCGEGGFRYGQDLEGPHYYCWKHAIEHGLCPVCGSIVGGIDTGEDEDDPPGESKEKALLVLFRELVHHAVRSKSSRVLKDAPPSPDSRKPALGHYFLSPKHAPPREQTCTTKHAPPVRFRP